MRISELYLVLFAQTDTKFPAFDPETQMRVGFGVLGDQNEYYYYGR